MKIKPCIIGLGYVGLPVILNLSKKFECLGFDINNKRIETLKKKIDSNKEFSKKDFYKRKLKFSSDFKEIKSCNFFIICVPTPLTKNKKPDLRNLNGAIKTVTKIIKKNDIIFVESTIYPGLTKKYKDYIQSKTGLRYNKDFHIGYSPERVNPGDKSNVLTKINKIVSIDTNSKKIISNVFNVYKNISKKIIFSRDIRAAETAKAIENIQRDINIALTNEILLICKKLKINFNEVLRLAETKWNFLKFTPGLVGGHCLPIDPYYLSSIAAKNNFKTKIILTGRNVNDNMERYVINELNKFLKKKNKNLKNSKILIVGISYKSGIADMRNSINFKIFKKLKNINPKVVAYDKFLTDDIKKNYKVLNKINLKNNYDAIIFLSKHKHFKKQYSQLIKNNNDKIIDPFYYYS
jgi:UDP-N-acetyl-D-glucosamine/UDP-N-acetyl-D-galactosamine dehydrogenase|tara:strand:+ start:575 stop:1798 length:1224 start_codon:yes stop_codon:yes gene_type:complete